MAEFDRADQQKWGIQLVLLSGPSLVNILNFNGAQETRKPARKQVIANNKSIFTKEKELHILVQVTLLVFQGHLLLLFFFFLLLYYNTFCHLFTFILSHLRPH